MHPHDLVSALLRSLTEELQLLATAAFSRIEELGCGTLTDLTPDWRAAAAPYEYSYNCAMKPVRFVGTARDDLAAFPEPPRRAAGYENVPGAGWERTIGLQVLAGRWSGVHEIRVRDRAGAFRVIYVAKFDQAVYVLQLSKRRRQRPPVWISKWRDGGTG